MGLRAAMALGKDMLQGSPVEAEAPLDLRILMAEALQISPSAVVIAPDTALTQAQEARFLSMVKQRRDGRSVAVIVGHREFWGRRFIVTDDVLVPRPETEALIALALEAPFAEVLDLGTGSGCIAITLLAERPEATGIATDLSQPALEVAARNAAAHGVADRLRFERSDWLSAIGGSFDLIVSNPPYITAEAFAALAPAVLAEPHMALTPGGDGLDPYRTITQAAPAHLVAGGRLMFEIGFDQGHAVAALCRDAGLEAVEVHPDLDGRDRVVTARRAGSAPD